MLNIQNMLLMKQIKLNCFLKVLSTLCLDHKLEKMSFFIQIIQTFIAPIGSIQCHLINLAIGQQSA